MTTTQALIVLIAIGIALNLLPLIYRGAKAILGVLGTSFVETFGGGAIETTNGWYVTDGMGGVYWIEKETAVPA